MSEQKAKVEWFAVVIATVGVFVQLGTWVWWGGRLSQRVDMLEVQMKAATRSDERLARENSLQASDIAVSKAQYTEILNQLNRIYSKLDAR